MARLQERPPTQAVILFANERHYDLDRCIWVAEQSLGLRAEGVIVTDHAIVAPEAGATVYLVDRDCECVFYFGAPQQDLVAVRTGNGRCEAARKAASAHVEGWVQRSSRDHRSWVCLALDAHDAEDGPRDPSRTTLLPRLTAGFMDDRALMLQLPEHDLLVRVSDALRRDLRSKPFAEALMSEG